MHPNLITLLRCGAKYGLLRAHVKTLKPELLCDLLCQLFAGRCIGILQMPRWANQTRSIGVLVNNEVAPWILLFVDCLAQSDAHPFALFRVSSEVRIVNWREWLRAAAIDVAGCADRIYVQGFVVIPMVIAVSRPTTIYAAEILRMSEEAKANRLTHHRISGSASVLFGTRANSLRSSYRLARITKSLAGTHVKQRSAALLANMLARCINVPRRLGNERRTAIGAIANVLVCVFRKTAAATIALTGNLDLHLRHRHLGDSIAAQCPIRTLDVIAGFDAVDQIGHEQLGELDLYLGWDAAISPVLDALNTAARLVVAQPLSNFRRAAKGIDDLAVGMKFCMFAHDVFIKHHV